MPVYDDEDQKVQTGNPGDEELRRLTGIGADEEGAMDREAHSGAAADTAERESLFNKTGDKKEPGQAGDDYGLSALDDIRSKVGRGYSGDDSKESALSRAFNGKSKLKKRLAIAGVVAAGSVAGSILVFFLMLPLKIESLVSNLENRYGSASSEAIDKETTHLFKGYLRGYVINNLGRPGCRSTVDADCVSTVTGDGPIKKLWKAWRQDKLTQKLADRYGLALAKSGNNYYINTNGKQFNFRDKAALSDVLSDSGTTSGERNQIESILSARVKEGTRWDRVYYRFRLAPFVNGRFGTRHCVNSCKAINKFTDKIAVKKLAAKAYIVDRVLSPLSQSYAFILQCALVGSGGCNVDTLQGASAGDTNLESDGNKSIETSLRNYASGLTDKELTDLVAKADDLDKEGLNKLIIREVVYKLVSIGGGDAAKAGATAAEASKAVDPFTWALLAAQLANSARNIGTTIKYLGYTANAAAAAQLFTTYQTVASESKSGQIDGAQLGSFVNAVSTGVETSDTSSLGAANETLKGTDESASDAAQTPYYQSILGPGNKTSSGGQSALLGGLSGTAFAATTTSTGYKCADGKPVPSGKLICSEEALNGGTDLAKFIETVSGWYDTYLNFIPGMNDALSVLNKINSFFNAITEKIFSAVEGPFKKVCDIPFTPCKAAMSGIQSAAATMLDFVMKQLIHSPFTDLSGGRVFDMMAAGASVVFNSSAQENLGAPQVDNQTAANIQAAYLNRQQSDFAQKPLFARMFSTDTPNSVVSRMALAMPSSVSSAGNGVAAAITSNPLSIFSSLVGSLFTHKSVFAADAADTNPFGVPQAAYQASQLPQDPEKFWDANCVTGPLGWWTESNPAGQQLDISQWLNAGHDSQHDDFLKTVPDGDRVAQARSLGMNVLIDSDTGQAVYINPNQCSLILATIQAAGGLADTTLLPMDTLSDDQAASSGSGIRIATFNVQGAIHTSSWQGRMDQSINVLTSHDIGISGMQEMEANQRSYLLNNVGSTYDIYPDHLVTDGNESQNSIIWDGSKFSLVKGGVQPNLKYFGGQPLHSPWVLLKDNTTNQEFYVLNTHDPARPENAYLRYSNAQEHVKFIQSLLPDGFPILYTGDFNSGYSLRSSGNITYQNKNGNLTYCIMTNNKLMNEAFDLSTSRNVTCPNPGNENEVDHIFMTPGVTVAGFTKVPPSQNGSDVHSTVIVDVNLP